MEHVLTPWLALTGAIAAMAIMVIWTRRDSILRSLAVAILFFAAPAAVVALGSALGWALPFYAGITAPAGDYTVLGSKMIAGQAIYVLADAGAGEPRYYRIPWDRKVADTLQDLLDDPGNGEVVMSVPMEFSFDNNAPQFWATPQPKVMPDKPPQEAAPHFDPDRAA